MSIADLMPMLRELSRSDKLQVIQLLASELAQEEMLSLDRHAFMKLPLDKRYSILQQQAELMANHYQQNSDWQELETGDIIEY